MIKQVLVISGLILALTGCTGSMPEVSYSGFDDAKTVYIQPHGNDCKGLDCLSAYTAIGAQWNSSSPNTAILLIAVFNDYTAITGATLNIDGRKVYLKETSTLNVHDSLGSLKRTTQGFVTSLDTVRDILSAKRVWLRVNTTQGYLEDPIIEGESKPKSYHALGRFMAEVDKP